MVEMEVVGVAPEPNSNKPLVWLKDKDQKVFLPISIGNFEATAIYMELYDEPPPRPICYDLVRMVLSEMQAAVDQILISDLKDDTFYAEIVVRGEKGVFTIDSRPSDAIAIALRTKAPIYAADSVLQEAGLEVESEDSPMIWEEEIESLGQPSSSSEIDKVTFEDVDTRVVTLRERLKDAVSKEEYEEAAKIRDELGRIDTE
jgi:bifunctional DNase/RNase|tara:strand:- start:861 stop:1466 length:606 start_codon:yes stop_codon:yes gene_type:complete